MDRLTCGLEVKFSNDQPEMTISGYGAVFGNIDSYGDVIAPGSFAGTLAAAKKSGQWPSMLAQHGGFTAGDMMPIGIWTEMREDQSGLYLEGRLADTERGREAYALLKMQPRPALNGLSIGFIAKEWSVRTKPEEPRRTLKAVELMEVSLVTFPANPKARVTGVKSSAGLSIGDAVSALIGAGFEQQEAAAIAQGGFKSIRRSVSADSAHAAALRLLQAMRVQ